jgi:hypothetical protein
MLEDQKIAVFGSSALVGAAEGCDFLLPHKTHRHKKAPLLRAGPFTKASTS